MKINEENKKYLLRTGNTSKTAVFIIFILKLMEFEALLLKC